MFLNISDIDECATNNHLCHYNATCNNTIGSHNCTCNPGYTGNGQNCTGKYKAILFLFLKNIFVGDMSVEIGIDKKDLC